jgi:predicted transcriptional regulator of viral defense system
MIFRFELVGGPVISHKDSLEFYDLQRKLKQHKDLLLQLRSTGRINQSVQQPLKLGQLATDVFKKHFYATMLTETKIYIDKVEKTFKNRFIDISFCSGYCDNMKDLFDMTYEQAVETVVLLAQNKFDPKKILLNSIDVYDFVTQERLKLEEPET